jgi:hypothetical protein
MPMTGKGGWRPIPSWVKERNELTRVEG